MGKIKILYVISGLEVGGAETMLKRIVIGIDKKKYYPVVCSLTTKGPIGEELEKQKIPVYSLQCKNSLQIFSALKKLKEIIKKEQPKIINGFMMHANLLVRLEKKSKDQKIICSVRERGIKTKFLNMIDKLTQNKVDKYIANAETVKEFMISYGIDKEKIKVIYNGIDIENFLKPLSLTEEEIRKKYGINNKKQCITMIANLRPQKDHETLIRAFAKANVDANLLICGSAQNFEKRKKKLEKLAKELSIGDKVYFLGFVKDTREILKIADIWISTTLYEGQSNALIEAMLFKKAIITTDILENRELLNDKKEALLCKPKDINDIAQKIKELFENKKMAKQLGKYAFEKAKKFKIEQVMQQLEQQYEEVLS